MKKINFVTIFFLFVAFNLHGMELPEKENVDISLVESNNTVDLFCNSCNKAIISVRKDDTDSINAFKKLHLANHSQSSENNYSVSKCKYSNDVTFSIIPIYTKWILYCEYCKESIFSVPSKSLMYLAILEKFQKNHHQWHLIEHEDFRNEYRNSNFEEGIDSEEKRYLEFKYPTQFGFRYSLFNARIIHCNVCKEREEIIGLENNLYVEDKLEIYIRKYTEFFREKHLKMHSDFWN